MSMHRNSRSPRKFEALVLNGFSGTFEVINHGEMLVSFEVSPPLDVHEDDDVSEPSAGLDQPREEGGE